jgi:hypothetical protein
MLQLPLKLTAFPFTSRHTDPCSSGCGAEEKTSDKDITTSVILEFLAELTCSIQQNHAILWITVHGSRITVKSMVDVYGFLGIEQFTDHSGATIDVRSSHADHGS